MDFLKKVFPLSFKCQEKQSFITALIVYVIAMAVVAVLDLFLGNILLIGAIVGITGSLVGIYCNAGIVFAILVFAKVFK